MSNEWKLYDCNSEEEYNYMLRKHQEEQEEQDQLQGYLEERNRIAYQYGFDVEINKLENELADYKKALTIVFTDKDGIDGIEFDSLGYDAVLQQAKEQREKSE